MGHLKQESTSFESLESYRQQISQLFEKNSQMTYSLVHVCTVTSLSSWQKRGDLDCEINMLLTPSVIYFLVYLFYHSVTLCVYLFIFDLTVLLFNKSFQMWSNSPTPNGTLVLQTRLLPVILPRTLHLQILTSVGPPPLWVSSLGLSLLLNPTTSLSLLVKST